MLTRNKQGQFQIEKGNTKYKNVQYKNQRMGQHKKVICIALNIDNLPTGFIVHHLNNNSRDNSIDNLAIMTITAHNRVHSHKPWNKGLKAGLSDKWDNARKKAQCNRFKTFFPQFKEAFELQTKGKKLREIAVLQGISRRQVSDRIKRYKNYIKSL